MKFPLSPVDTLPFSAVEPVTAPSRRRSGFLPWGQRKDDVPRARLLSKLHGGAARFILLHAPAGYGKSTLMEQLAQGLESQGALVGWLGLDQAGHDPVQLLSELDAMLAAWDGAPLAAAETAPGARRDGPAPTLFIDAFERLNTPAALDAARQFVERLPAHVRLIIGSRERPELNLERYRLGARLLELSAAEIGFDGAETQKFLQTTMTASLAAGMVDGMRAATNGWPALLWFSLPGEHGGCAGAQSAGNWAAVRRFLDVEVLAGLAPAVQAFLLDVCALPRLTAAACDAATGRPNGLGMLQHLEYAGILAPPLPLEQRWYALPSLLADVLRERQADTLYEPGMAALHRRAALWFYRHGTVVEAIDLWLLAGDTETALREMPSCLDELLSQAQFATILRWTGRLDEAALDRAGPSVWLAAAWAQVMLGERQVAQAWLRRLKADIGPEHALYDQLVALEAIYLCLCGDTRAASALALTHWQRLCAGRSLFAGVVANVISHGLALAGDFSGAARILATARGVNEERDSAVGLCHMLLGGALIDAMQGKLEQAVEQCRAIDKLGAQGRRRTWFLPYYFQVAPIAMLASMQYEQGKPDEAYALLQRYLPAVLNQPSTDMLVLCHIVLTRLQLARGDVDGARNTLEQADLVTAGRWQFARVHRLLEWERVRLELHTGAEALALARAAMIERAEALAPPSPGYLYVEELYGSGIESIRCEIARGRGGAALLRLDDEIWRAASSGRNWRLLKLRLLRTLALDAGGDGTRARDELVRALQLGAAMGARASFAEQGERLADLLRELPASALALLPDGVAVTRYWRGLGGEEGSAPPSGVPGAGALNPREHAVLVHIAAGRNNEQIAAKLFLSVHTVKWYVRRILEKLAARNRNEAVFVASRNGLIKLEG